MSMEIGAAVEALKALSKIKDTAITQDIMVNRFRLGEVQQLDVSSKFPNAVEKDAGEQITKILDHQEEEFRPDGKEGSQERTVEVQNPPSQEGGESLKDVRSVEADRAAERDRCGREYFEDLNEKAHVPVENPPDVNQWSPVKTSSREDFQSSKSQLIKEWEAANDQSWPRYKEDFFIEGKERPLRLAGDKYDAHHIQPLKYGGENTPENLVPVHAKDHYDHKGVHRPDGPLARIESFLEKKV